MTKEFKEYLVSYKIEGQVKISMAGEMDEESLLEALINLPDSELLANIEGYDGRNGSIDGEAITISHIEEVVK